MVLQKSVNLNLQLSSWHDSGGDVMDVAIRSRSLGALLLRRSLFAEQCCALLGCRPIDS